MADSEICCVRYSFILGEVDIRETVVVMATDEVGACLIG